MKTSDFLEALVLYKTVVCQFVIQIAVASNKTSHSSGDENRVDVELDWIMFC